MSSLSFQRRSLEILVTLTLLTPLIFYAQGQNSSTQGGVIVPGIYIEESDDFSLLTYEALVPILFEFKLNSEIIQPISANTPEPRIVPKISCRNDMKTLSSTTVPWLYTCPVFFHMNNLLSQLKGNFTDSFFTPNFNPRARFTSSENVLFINRELYFEECETQLRSIWTGINIRRDVGLSEYRSVIESCAAASYFEENITDFSGNMTLNNGIFEKMRDNFISNFNDSTEGTSVSMLLALQSLLTLNSYSEINRWKEATASCQNNFIPYSLVKVGRLETALGVITEQLALKRFNRLELATTLRQLFELPVADCILGTRSLFVRILVPFKRVGKIYRPLRITRPQFLYDTETCRVNSNDSGKKISQLNLLYDSTSKEIIESKCDFRSGGFCRVNSKILATSQNLMDKCLTAVVLVSDTNRNKNIFENLRNFCGIECEVINSTSKSTFPIVQKVSSNKFLITTNVITPLLVKCEAFGFPDQIIHPQKYGGTEVTIPCGCYLMLHTDKYYPNKPCSTYSNTPIIHHALPIQMINTTFNVPYISQGFQSPRITSFYSSRYSLINLANYVNMTFRDEDIVEVDLGERPNTSNSWDEINRRPSFTDEVDEIKEILQNIGPTTHEIENSTSNQCCIERISFGIWVFLIVQFLIMITICSVAQYRMYWSLVRIERRTDGPVSFSNATSQITLVDK